MHFGTLLTPVGFPKTLLIGLSRHEQYTSCYYSFPRDWISLPIYWAASFIIQVDYFIAAVLVNTVVNITTCGMYIAVLVTALRASKKHKTTKIESTKTSRSSKLNVDGNETEPELRLRKSLKAVSISIQNAHKRRSSLTTVAMTSWNLAYIRELRLATSGFLMFLSMLAYLIFLLGVAVEGSHGFRFAYLWNIASDIFAYTSPYTLIIMSKQTRTALRKLLICKKFWLRLSDWIRLSETLPKVFVHKLHFWFLED